MLSQEESNSEQDIHIYNKNDEELNTRGTTGKKEKPSAIHRHINEMTHQMDWVNSKVVLTESNDYKLLIKESLIIKAYQPDLNKTTHSVPLHIYPEGINKRHLPKV